MHNAGSRWPRVAHVVAAALRDRILSGELPPGAELPKQEELLAQFNVSLPSLREALSILETERLVTVQRGKQGGARVHAPNPELVSYAAARLLQSRRIPIDDVVFALRRLDPMCTALCAERSDRRRTAVRVLEETHRSAAEAMDSPERYARLARGFHEQVVAMCGNDSIGLMVGSLARIWWAHDEHLAIRGSQLGPAAGRAYRESTHLDHAAILDAIVAGDARAAEAASCLHYRGVADHALIGRGITVNAELLRQTDGPGGAEPWTWGTVSP